MRNKKDQLIEGEVYRVFRNGQFIGTGKYMNDPNIGMAIMQEMAPKEFMVIVPMQMQGLNILNYSWKLVKNN